MAKQIEGIYENLILCAKKEFLEKGFKDASLRTIASNANTSTGSIYTRFKDKEGLFQAIVEPVVDGLKKQIMAEQVDFHEKEPDVQVEEVSDYSQNALMKVVDYIYQNFDEFDILVNSSYGTEYSDFLNEIVEIEVDYTCKYMDVIGSKTMEDGLLTSDVLHIITTAYMNGIFEVVRHKMTIEEAKKYMKVLYRYHRSGFDVLFDEKKLIE